MPPKIFADRDLSQLFRHRGAEEEISFEVLDAAGIRADGEEETVLDHPKGRSDEIFDIQALVVVLCRETQRNLKSGRVPVEDPAVRAAARLAAS